MTNDIIDTPEIVIEKISPERAKEILKFNTENFRTPEKKRIIRYANDMAAGEWELTGDTIKIKDGKLVDGQHRLIAVIKSGATIETAVAYNMTGSGFYVDRGKPRTFQQWLSHAGIKNANAISASTRLILMHDKKKWKNNFLLYSEFSDREMMDYVEKYEQELQSAVRAAKTCAHVLPQSMAAAVIHIGSGRSKYPEEDKLVDWFWKGVAFGADLQAADPPLTLRNRCLTSKSIPGKRMTHPYQRWLITLAWNKAVQGEQAATLRLTLTGPTRTTPPECVLVSPGNE